MRSRFLYNKLMTLTLLKENHAKSVNEVIERYFQANLADSAKVGSSYETLYRATRDLFNSGGKKLRSQMLISAYEAFGGKNTNSILPVAAAQELLHLCLLIHDDIIDRDYTRYGVKNIAGFYKAEYNNFAKSEEDLVHYAHGASILAGDLMLSGSYQLIFKSNLDDSAKTIALNYLSRGVQDVAGGELLDMELSFMPYQKGDALKVAQYKTASYSFVSPLLCGAELAGISSSKKDALKTFAGSLGVAFQLVDDIIGVFGDEKVTGKSNTSDIIEGKQTYLIEQAIPQLSEHQKTTFYSGFGNTSASDVQIDRVRELLISSGAKEKTLDLVQEYKAKASSALNELELDSSDRQTFDKLVELVVGRIA